MARGPYFTYRPGGLGDRFFGSDPLVTLQRELNRVFEDLELPTRQAAAQGGSGPSSLSVDVSESADAFTVHADLPGVRPEDVDVQLNEDTLTIRGERQSMQRGERDNVHYAERASGAFQRSVRLPSAVDGDGVQARFEHGVLTITLPKIRAAERSRKIPIQGVSASSQVSGGGSAQPDLGAAVVQSYTQGDGAQGASPAAGSPEPTDPGENATKPGGSVHGYNE